MHGVMRGPRRQHPDLGLGASESTETSGLSLKELVDIKQRSIICFTNFIHLRMRKDTTFFANKTQLRPKEEKQECVECSAKIEFLFQITFTLIRSVKGKYYMCLLSFPF